MTAVTQDDTPLAYEEQAAEWCWRIADRALTEHEQAQFDAWIRADPRHQQVFDDMVAVWKGTDTIAEMPGFLSLRAKALTTMENARDRDESSSYGRSFGHGRWFRALAAAAALILMVCGSFWFFASGTDVYETGVGERRIVRLEDGSRISLDASSRVIVAYSEDRRALTLERGRAKFDVAKEPLRPFSVTAGNQAVVATGTAFSVELLRGQMRVLLYEGQVAVVAQPAAGRTAVARTVKSDERAAAPEPLMPGQELISSLSSGAVRIVPAKMDRSLSWEDGRLDFVDEPLARAVERINRYTDTPIVIGDAAAGRLLVNGVFDAGDTQSFVRGMTALFPLAAKYHDKNVTLVSGKEPLAAK